jgi:hypothetical protein
LSAPLVIWQVLPVESLDPALLRDLEPRGRPFAVIRTGVRRQVWGFHANRPAAERAMKRARMREIATR